MFGFFGSVDMFALEISICIKHLDTISEVQAQEHVRVQVLWKQSCFSLRKSNAQRRRSPPTEAPTTTTEPLSNIHHWCICYHASKIRRLRHTQGDGDIDSKNCCLGKDTGHDAHGETVLFCLDSYFMPNSKVLNTPCSKHTRRLHSSLDRPGLKRHVKHDT